MPRNYQAQPKVPMPNTGKPGVQPIQVAPGGPQGSRQQLVEAQRAVPLPDSDEQMQGALQEAQQFQPPPPLDRPTDFPGEPVTAGMQMGAGAGPEMNSKAQAPMEFADYKRLAHMLPTLELMASRPGSSQGTRNLIRKIRAAQAPDLTYPVVQS